MGPAAPREGREHGGPPVKVVDRHLAAEFGRVFLAATTAFLALFLVVDFFEHMRTILKHDAAAWDVILFFAARLPWMLSQVLPMGTLLATLLSLAILSRQGEMTALRCGGLTLGRLALPYLACGLGVALLNAFVQEAAVPRGFSLASEIEQVRIKGRPPATVHDSENLWLRSGNRFVHVDRVLPPGDHLLGVSVAELSGWSIARRLDAREARWREQGWELLGVEERVFGSDGTFTAHRRDVVVYPLAPGPEDFDVAERRPEESSWAELSRRIERSRARGLNTRDLEVSLWAKTSLPFVNVIMPLLAFPFAVRTRRRGGAPLAVVTALGLGFAYWIVLGVGLSLGRTGTLPPVFAAWVGNLLFTALGVHLLRGAERAP